MKNVDIISRVVARKGETISSSSKGAQKNDFSDYLLKSIWEKVFEIRTDSQGTDYIFSKLPVVTQYGITMYSGDGVDIPSLASGLPFDGRTIWYNPDTNQIEVIGGTGGGSGEGVSNFWDLRGIPSWITISKPKYTYSEIEGTPDLRMFATQNWIISQGYASAEELKKYIPISGYTEVSGEKNFTGGLKVNGSPIYYDTEKKYWKLEGDLLVTGGVTMYGVDSTDIPSLINSLPVATTKEKGVAYFDPDFFSVSSDGKVSFIGETGGGLDIVSLQNYLTQNSYLNATEGDNRYLKLSGGKMNASAYISWNDGHEGNDFSDWNSVAGETGLKIISSVVSTSNAPSTYSTALHVKGRYGFQLASIGGGNSEFYIRNIRDISDWRQLIHSGNINSFAWTSSNDGADSGLDADLLDGKHADAFALSNTNINLDSFVNQIGYGFKSQGWYESGAAMMFGANRNYYMLLQGASYGSKIYLRANYVNNGSYVGWKDIAFTDSNVASATKLQTARTIWGNSFDGTGNVYGAIKDTYGILPYSDSTYDIGSASNQYRYVYASWFGAKTGKGLSLGTNNSTHLAIISSGNVGIGTTSPKSKLSVHTYIVESISSGYLGTSNTVGFGNMVEGYGTYLWTTGNGNGHIQVGRENGETTLYHLILQELGGNVGIGTTTPSHKLHVVGNILATEGITTNDSVTINGIRLSKSKDGVLYLDGNLVVKGGVTMYGTDVTSSPSIFDSLPVASTTKRGIAYFDSEFFSVGSDGKVSFVGKTDGFNATELQNYLTQNSYLNTTSGDNRYLKLSGGELDGSLTINNGVDLTLKAGATNQNDSGDLVFANYNGEEIGRIWNNNGVFCLRYSSSDYSKVIIHNENYSQYALPLSGGTLTGVLTVNSNLGIGGYIINRGHYLFARDNANADWVVTTKNWGAEYTLWHSGNFTPSNYLPLSGGQLNREASISWGNASNGLTDTSDWNIKTDGLRILSSITSGSNAPTQYAAGLHVVGRYGFQIACEATSSNFYMRNIRDGVNNWCKLWHTGNDGSGSGLDADTLDGLDSENFFYERGHIVNYADANNYWRNGAFLNATGNGTGNSNFPQPYSIFVNFTSGQFEYISQLSLGIHNAYYRVKIDSWSDWREFAFTDSNVASATKLQTPRTIWGQSFDGTGNVTGSLSDVNNISMNGSISGVSAICNNTTNGFYIGGRSGIGATDGGALIYTYGSTPISFYAGAERMTILSNGNVGIGTKSPTDKLHVVGNTYLNGDVFADELNTFDVLPRTSNAYSCGDGNLRWYQMYSYIGDFSGAVNMGSTLNVTGMTTMTNATITGYLRLKDTTNYGRAIYFGDGELCYLEEASDDVLTIYANAGIKLNTSSTSYNVSINTNLLVSGGITMYSQRSLKNIQDDRGLSLDELRAIKPIRYTWKDNRDNRLHIGGIADDIQQVLPEVVYKTNDGVLTMDYGNAAFAIASSLIKPIIDHEKRIAMLEEENKQLRQEVERLKSA